MLSFVRRWARLLVGAVALLLVTVFARGAHAFPNQHNVDTTVVSQSLYITTANLFTTCASCHGGPAIGRAAVNPVLSIVSGGTGSGTSFFVQPNATATFKIAFNNNPAGFGGAGGFLVFHDVTTGGSNNAQGHLTSFSPGGGNTATHACPDDGTGPDDGISPFTGTACGGTTNGNTEVTHAFPATGATSSFEFKYTAPATCSGSYSFTLWVNSANGDSMCTDPDSPYAITFTIGMAACNDGDACTSGDFCFAGSCFSGTSTTCTASDQCHSAGVCNSGTGFCSNPTRAGSCDDSNACTTGDFCSAGSCISGTSTTCTAIDQCHSAGACNTGTGVCTNPTRAGSCDDGNACTVGDVCAGGSCVSGSTTTCPAPDQCHSAGACNTGTGVCSNPPLTGNSCSDGNTCTIGDTCQAGVCVSGPGVTCTALDQCHGVGTCSGGVCTNPALTGTSCTDSNACTTGDSCQAGTCQPGGPTPTDDGNVCTIDSCTPGGGVTHTAAAANTVCHDGSRGVCDAVVTCGGATTCPALNVDHTNKQCSPPSCTAGTATPAEQCDGTSFNCPTATPVSCGGAVCSGTACSGGCGTDDANCTPGNFCLASVCTPKRAVGQTCSANNYCANGQCVDGVCCNTTCGGSDPTDCQACNLAGKVGTCSVPVGTTCRASAGICDAAELCVAGNTACPANAPAAANTVCRASTDGNLCDPAETCSGQFTCPADAPTRDDTACTNDGNVCSKDLCESNVCTHDQAAGTSVVCRASGGVCDPAETCPAAGTACPGNTLFDGTHQCRAAAAGTNCDVPEFCAGGVNCPTDGFAPGTQSCRTASCSSGSATPAAKCTGGSATCPVVVLDDCTPYVCQGTACGTTCNAKTDCDTGFFCNAAKKCVPELPPGSVCSAADSCGTGICVDGICCNSQCTGQCQACDVPGKLGTCSPVPATDKVPHGARPKCSGDATACHGFCDGTNTASCALPGSTTQCLAPSCTAGVATAVEVCNGSGTCPTDPPVTCAPGICQAATGPKAICVGGTGGAPCTADVECSSGNYCVAGLCKPKKGDGTTCSADDQCTNSHCVDGLCCNTSCDGQCEACDVASAKGTCTAVTGPTHTGRPACVTDSQFPSCAGQCDGKNRLSCTFPGAGTTCREASCTNDIATLPAFCTGTGTCSPAQEQACDAGNGCNAAGKICDGGCTADRDCSIGKYCSGGVCVPTLPTGGACSDSSQCTGPCVDGFCCQSACDHQCEACNVVGSEGICKAITGAPAGLRPACATDGTSACAGKCNGVNHDACTYPGSTISCSAGACADGVATVAGFCDGAGSCPDPQHQICAPDDCAATKCGGACAVSGTCPAGQYCSAGECKAKLPPKSTCNLDSDCGNGICTDGFCCDSQCTGQCQACDVPGSQGVCTIVVGDLPHGGRAACGGFGACASICDGSSPTACNYAPATTTCGKSSCSVNGGLLGAPLCNGAGACLASSEVNCGAYTCDPGAGACQTTCILPSDCAPGYDCIDAKCQISNDAGIVDAGAGGAPDMPDASVTPDASTDGMAPDTGTDAAVADSGNAGASDGGPVLVPPEHSTDKGSCGCSVPGSESGSSSFLLFGAALTALGIANRRRRRAVERSARL